MEKIKKSAVPVWPLVLIAGSAFVAIWSGWVGLGQMTGFGMVELLPGIVEDWEINSAITLPIGMEVYAAFALRVYLAPPPGLSKMAKRYAAISAFAALGLGAAGQVTYHLMQAEGLTVAPWQITTFVSCLPVAVLAAAAALLHLVRSARTTVTTTLTVEVPAAAPAASPVPLLQTPADLEAEREHARRLVAEEEREEHLRAQERDDVARDQDQDGDLLRVLLDA
ncbi:MAG TPA: hypothetical protein VEY30_02595, partial [Myxococcaceae bacterium]|nr:hypothetical protein [Myxococcaceae bacterium]